jgi:hypothetical protein
MSYGTDGLSFNTLRDANAVRLPLFRNRHGQLAHKQPDGSDWNPAQWLQALLGELGEFATVRMRYEAEEIEFEEYQALARKELPDVQIYLDLLAYRSLDAVYTFQYDPAQYLMALVAHLGEYANARKKYERGDFTWVQFVVEREKHLSKAVTWLNELRRAPDRPTNLVTNAHPSGVDLGRATIDKFNEVSERVGCRVYMDADGWHLHPEHEASAP